MPLPQRLERAVHLAAFVYFTYHFPTLWRSHSIAKGKATVKLVAILTALALAAEKFAISRAGGKSLATLKNAALSLVIGATVLGFVLIKKILRRGDTPYRHLIGICFVPTLTEFLVEGEGDVPAILALLLGLLMGQTEAAAVILLMVTGGEVLEERALNRAGEALHTLLREEPGLALIEKRNGEITTTTTTTTARVKAENVEIGDVVVVKSREVVPLDGILLLPPPPTHDANDNPESEMRRMNDSGVAEVDEKLLTGETATVRKRAGETILAGSLNNSNETIRIRVDKRYVDSVLHQMKTQLAAALERKSKIEFESRRLADSLTPLTLVMACLGHAITMRRARRRGMPTLLALTHAWNVVLSLFMSATPCPAAIGVPVAMLSGMSRASRSHASTVKTGTALEAMADARVVVLDKTGTVTTGEPSVTEFRVESGREMGECLRAVASLEAHVKHVLADAVVKSWRGNLLIGSSPLFPLSGKVVVEPGLGVYGSLRVTHGDEEEENRLNTTNDRVWRVYVGEETFVMRESGLGGDKAAVHPLSLTEREMRATRAYFVVMEEEELVGRGVMSFRDELRPEAKLLVNRLKARGKHVVMLSGDRSARLEEVASELGITEFHACLPHEKVLKIREYQAKYGKVIMVGDGGNDSAALAAADAGVSIDPSSVAVESASVVVMDGNLARVEELLGMSARSVGIARDTVIYGTLASVFQMCLALAGLTSPFQNAVLQEMIDLASIAHSAR